MAWSRLQYLLMQLSPLTHTSLAAFSLQSCRRLRCSAVTGGCDGLRLCWAQAWPIARRLANLQHRIEFTFVWDCFIACGCFPPSLAATQLPFASPPFPGSVAIRFSLTGLYIVMVTRAAPSSARTCVVFDEVRISVRCPMRRGARPAKLKERSENAPALPFSIPFH